MPLKLRILVVALLGLGLARLLADTPAPASASANFVDSPPGAEGLRVWKDIVYAQPDGHPLKLDVYRRISTAEPPPLLVYIHGGGWQSIDKSEGFANAFLQKGFALACIDYRLSQQAIFPAQVYDCKAAIRWLRANGAQFGCKVEKMGVIGDSAGGHLVSMLGVTANHSELEGDEGNLTTSSTVQAVCDYFGPSDLTVFDPTVADHAIEHLLGGTPQDQPARARAASPLFYVSSATCPFFIVQGDKDTIVPLEQSQKLYHALKDAGVEVQLDVIAGGQHGVNNEEAIKRASQFFHTVLD